jgi:hypothetical protein
VSGAGETQGPGTPRPRIWLRWLARVWAELAIVGYLLWEATTPAPVRGQGGYWERLAALLVVAVIVVGHLLSWQWEIQGATVMAVGGALLGLVTSFRFEGLRETAIVLVAFTGPAVLYWWLWRRGRSRRAVAGLAGLLAALGVYGVVSYVVQQRTAEIGVRMALGATRRDVLQLMLGQGMRPVVAGVVLGLVGAAALSRVLGALLFGVTPGDVPSYAVAAVGLTLAALAATLVPARRAVSVDPAIALRGD